MICSAAALGAGGRCHGRFKVRISASRKALGTERDFVRTEFGRGYRFIGMFRSNATAPACAGSRPATLRSVERLLSKRRRFEATA